jgi:hypothetical protein
MAMFRDALFSAPPEADLREIQSVTYDHQMKLPPVTAQKVREVIYDLVPLKAPGSDRIINKSSQLAEPWLKPHLTRTFDQSLILSYCPPIPLQTVNYSRAEKARKGKLHNTERIQTNSAN